MADLPPLLQAALQLRAETSISRLFLPAMDDNNCPPLSPAAQAVLDAVLQVSNLSSTVPVAAAALRAAVDRVMPVSDRPDPSNEFEYGQWLAKRITSGYLLAIADELEGAQ